MVEIPIPTHQDGDMPIPVPPTLNDSDIPIP